MKVTVKEPSNGKSFPKLMVSSIGEIVFFQDEDYGILLLPGDTALTGKQFSDWDIEDFKDFYGEITLSNE
jgi:hypothetical protein